MFSLSARVIARAGCSLLSWILFSHLESTLTHSALLLDGLLRAASRFVEVLLLDFFRDLPLEIIIRVGRGTFKLEEGALRVRGAIEHLTAIFNDRVLINGHHKGVAGVDKDCSLSIHVVIGPLSSLAYLE